MWAIYLLTSKQPKQGRKRELPHLWVHKIKVRVSGEALHPKGWFSVKFTSKKHCVLPHLLSLAARVNFIQLVHNFPQCKPRAICQSIFQQKPFWWEPKKKCFLGMQFSEPSVQFWPKGKHQNTWGKDRSLWVVLTSNPCTQDVFPFTCLKIILLRYNSLVVQSTPVYNCF